MLNETLNEEPNKNPDPYIFSSADIYLKFNEYASNHIIDFYLDYSYLKKRLEHEKLIHRIKDNDFMRFLLGWMPTHHKINDYEMKKVDEALQIIRSS